MSSKAWIAMVSKDLQKHGRTFNEFTKNPLYLMEISPKYEKLMLSKYSTNNDFTWYNKNTRLSELISVYPNKQYAEKLVHQYPDLGDSMDNEGNNIYFLYYR